MEAVFLSARWRQLIGLFNGRGWPECVLRCVHRDLRRGTGVQNRIALNTQNSN